MSVLEVLVLVSALSHTSLQCAPPQAPGANLFQSESDLGQEFLSAMFLQCRTLGTLQSWQFMIRVYDIIIQAKLIKLSWAIEGVENVRNQNSPDLT